jgi:hypothetical protein
MYVYTNLADWISMSAKPVRLEFVMSSLKFSDRSAPSSALMLLTSKGSMGSTRRDGIPGNCKENVMISRK